MFISKELSARANAILKVYNNHGIFLTPLELQKLLYLDYGRYLMKHNEPIESMQFEAWKYGPVLPEIYTYYAHLGNNLIKSKVKAHDGIKYCLKNLSLARQTYRLYHDLSAKKLVQLTHREYGAWRKVYGTQIQNIPVDEIRNEFVHYNTHDNRLHKFLRGVFE